MERESTYAPEAPLSQRLALQVLQLGAIAVVLAASTYRAFDLDRFLVPKELALHVTAVLVLLLTIRTARSTRIELLLLAFIVLSAVSAALAANRWFGFRALAITASSVAIFRAARALREAGLARALLSGVAFAVVLAAITSLAQAYGFEPDLFALNRAPGGTLGNRNFVGHIAAFGLPVVLLVALRASTTLGFLAASMQAVIVVASLVLTRSRAAWLAVATALLVMLFAVMVSPFLRRMWGRWAFLLLLAGGGIAAALLIPNTLRWRSENPYLESAIGVASYEEGSGRGRLIQYERSLRMALAHPLFGVGAGNWPVVYPKFAARRDPSMDQNEAGRTSNPWPSSDWISFVSERGLVAAFCLAIVFAVFAWTALKSLRRAIDAEEALGAMALLGTVVAAGITGAFDAVLLLAAPALLVWATSGALWNAPQLERGGNAIVGLVLIVLSATGAARSGAQLVGMDLYERGQLQTAARIDPANYRAQLRLAERGRRQQRCEHARAAHALFPNAAAARALARSCDD